LTTRIEAAFIAPLATAWQATNASYNAYGPYLKRKYDGQTVYKVIVDAGFTCPNRDGSKGYGGCTYCNVDSFTPRPAREQPTIREQVETSMDHMRNRYGAEKFIIYFQPNTNTYADVDKLAPIYEEALSVAPELTVGLSVGTRADCLDDEKLALFDQIAAKGLDVDLEIGMESIYDRTLLAINRGMLHHEFEDMMERIGHDRLWKVGVHTIFGLPGESREDQLAVAEVLNRLTQISYVKLHHLYIVTGSVMGVRFARNPWPLYSLEEYADFLVEFMPLLRPDLVIQRLFGVSDKEFHIAPQWGLGKSVAQSFIQSAFRRNGIKQGAKFGTTQF